MILFVALAAVTALQPVGSHHQPAPAPTKASSPLLIRLMDRTMSGRGAIAVSAGEPIGQDAHPEQSFRNGDKLLTRLQAVADAATSDRLTLIPFRVGDAWVLAPQTQEVPNYDPRKLHPVYSESQSLLIGRALIALSEDQVRQLGTDMGIAVCDLPASAQDRLAQAFQPQLDIVDRAAQDAEKDAGKPYIGKAVATLTEPIDWNRARIHAELVTSSIGGSLPDGDFAMLWGRPRPARREFRLPVDSPHGVSPGRPKFFVTAPNKFKPSDLDTQAFTQPIGMSGVQPLPKVLERLSTVTGLKLAGQTYRTATVYLGSGTLRCCDVMDGIRLALTAAWRRFDDTYILAWDREGLAAVHQRLLEAAGGIDYSDSRAAVELWMSNAWLPLLRSLPFVADDPLALTDDQRRRLLQAPEDRTSPAPRITFAEMTAGQKAAVVDRAAETQIKGPGGLREFTPAEVARTSLSGDVSLELRVQIPDYGWVYAPNEDWAYGLVPSLADAVKPRTDVPGHLPEMWRNPRPWPLNAPVRGLMVPVLGPARLTELAAEMARHGFNTLFYPVLYGGYATFPTDAFPLHPALRDANGWAAAVASMRDKGITVVGYLETLAWQTEGDNAHWLNNHPEWLDRDVLGRPRLSWIDGHANAGRGGWPPVNANYVSPLVPGVEDRLTRFLGDFARQPDATAVGFAGFRPPEDASPYSLVPPPLGFTTQERLECFRATGSDRVDLWPNNVPIGVPLNLLWAVHMDYKAFYPPENAPDPRAALVARLLNKARALKPGWKTWLLDDVILQHEPRPVPESEKPKADVFLSASSWDRRPDEGHLISISPKRTNAPRNPPPGAIDVSGIPSIILDTFDGPAVSTESRIAIVYDFRAAPNDITGSLEWILPPEAPHTAR